ncbi:hypothetical protein ACRAWD_10115 [Caulobacter segnis]
MADDRRSDRSGPGLRSGGGCSPAQDAAPAAQDDSKVEEIVVTGIRRGIEGAISLKKKLDLDRRSRLGRRHRQACWTSRSAEIDRAPSLRPDRPAPRRPRPGHLDPRPRARLHHRPAERPRAGLDRRQPRRRVRPVSVGTAERRRGLQDPGRRPDRPGPGRHRRHAHRPPAGFRQAGPGDRLRYEWNDIGALNAGDQGARQSDLDLVHRPVPWTVSWAWPWATPAYRSRPIRPNAGTPGATPPMRPATW